MAKFEWIDDSGLRHPSLVYLDITDIPDTSDRYRLDVMLEQAKVLKVKRSEGPDGTGPSQKNLVVKLVFRVRAFGLQKLK